ncbi:MAG: hypothetical protein ACKVH8_03775 [Pirellulales bacterium]
MAFGHTDGVPNTFDPEALPTPESSAVLHDSELITIFFEQF